MTIVQNVASMVSVSVVPSAGPSPRRHQSSPSAATTSSGVGNVRNGDAAHAMNPHASQGRMQAMVDAMTLADIVPGCLAADDCSAGRLSAYEAARRPQVTMLQRLADQQVFYWNTGNPVIAWLRDRVFRTLDRNARLRCQVLSTTAGLRKTAPLSFIDRLIAAGFLPDPYPMPHADTSSSARRHGYD